VGERKEDTKRKRVEKGNSPNNKIPAIVDPNVEGEPVSIMDFNLLWYESGKESGKGEWERVLRKKGEE
jgi:hypothetical protein